MQNNQNRINPRPEAFYHAVLGISRITEPSRTPCVHHTVHCLPGLCLLCRCNRPLYTKFTDFWA